MQSHWSSGMIPRSGRGGPGFESRMGPYESRKGLLLLSHTLRLTVEKFRWRFACMWVFAVHFMVSD